MGTIALSEIKTRIRKVLNEYSRNGELVGATEENRMDLDLRMNSLIDMHQRSLAISGVELNGRKIAKRISRSYVFTQYPPLNTISNPLSMFDIVQFTGETKYYSGGVNVKSYYFEADGTGICYIKESLDGITWNLFETINLATTRFGLMTAYKANITPTTGYSVRFEFTGTTTYNIRNIAFYNLAYPTDNDIPPYKDPRPYVMPSDFYKLEKVILNGQAVDSKKYQATSDWSPEGKNYIYIPWAEKGEYRFYYWAYPTVIDDDTLDTAFLDIDDDGADVVIYDCALDLIEANEDNKYAYNSIKAMRDQFLLRLDDNQKTGGSSIVQTIFSKRSANKLF